MEEGFNNANNPFGVTNGSTTDNIIAPTDGLLLNLSDKLKQNGTDLSPSDDFFEKSNGKRSASEFDDEDFGPETDVDTVDDFPSPGLKDEVAKSFADCFPSPNNNPLVDEGVFNPFMEHQEKAALEMEKNMRKRETNDEFDDDELMAREETPTPPADVVHDVSGLVENPGDSESEDEWNYIKGEEANKENISPQPEKEVADIPEEDDTMSQLNPNAAEFVPVSPTRSIPSPACRMLINDPIVSQSPKKANEVDINLPNPKDFENEVKSRPSEVGAYNNGHKDDDDHDTSKDLMENILNGKNIDEIPEFQPGSTPKKVFQNDEFHFGPNAAPFSPKLLDQSEALSTKALFGDESEATVDISFNESANRDLNILNKESDPMSMSFYGDKGDNNPFDLNKVQQLPDNLDDFLKQPDNETFNETISDLPEHNPLGELKNNDDAIQITDLDKQAYDDEKELASPLEPEKELLNTEEADLSKTPEPTSECLLEEFCKLPENQKLIINVPEDLSEVSDLLRSDPENLPPDVELLPNFDLPPSEPLKLSDPSVEITNLPVEPKPVFEKESLEECDIPSNRVVCKLPSELFEGLQDPESVVCDNSGNPDLISISQSLPEQPQAVSPLCDRPESMSSACDLSESKSPMPEEPMSAGSEDYTRPEFIQEAQDRFEELCKPLESPQEEVTSSVKDDLSQEHEDVINVIPNQNEIIGDSFVQEDVEKKQLENLEEIPPSISPIDNLVMLQAPPPKMCVYPIKTIEKEEYIPFDVKTENILPEFAEPTIVTPLEESRTEEMIIEHVGAANEQLSETQKVALELEAEMTAIGVTSTVATGAAITAVLTESKVEEEKKFIEKKQERKSDPLKKTPIRESLLKDRSTSSKSSVKRATSPKSPLKAPTPKTGIIKTTPTRPKTNSNTTPPLKKQPIKSLQKMTNGETKTSAKPLSARKPLETSAKLGVKPTAATATLRGTQNKLTSKPQQITITKTATSRPVPPASARPAPITKRPTTLSKSHSGAIEKASVTAKQLSSLKAKPTTTILPKPATTVPSKPKPTSTVIQPPSKGRLTVTKDKSKTLPDTEKQIKENVNKITASRTVTQRTVSAPVRSTIKSTTAYQKSVVNSARTTVMKSTTATVKSTLSKKKPTDIVKTTAVTKTSPTKIEKPKENGISTVITEEITAVNKATVDQKNEINLN